MNLTTFGWSFATILLWGLIPIIDKLALSQYVASPLQGIAIRAAGVAVVALPLAGAFGGGLTSLKQMPAQAVALFFASGLVSLLVAQYAYYALLQQAAVSRVFPLLFSAAPLVTLLIGVLFLKEPMSAKQILGALLVIGGGILLL